MTKIKARNSLQRIEVYWPWILLILLLETALLWAQALGDVFSLQNFWKGLFYALQFIVLNKDLDFSKETPHVYVQFGLQVTQFVVPVTASAAFLGNLFHEQIEPLWRERIARGLNRHHVIVGHGALGQALSSLIARSQNVVAVDALANEHLDSVQLIQLQQDALSPTLFDAANMEKAQCVYLLLPKERDNLTILASLASRRFADNVTVFVRAESNDLRRLLADSAWLKNWMPEHKLDIRPINPYDTAARRIVNDYSPDIFAPTDRKGHIAQTILVVGVSAMAQALILRFARLGVYSPKGKLRLIWAGRGVTDALAEMADSYPALKPGDHPGRHWGRPVDMFGEKYMSDEIFHLMLSPIEIVTIEFPAADAVRDNRVGAICGQQWPSAVYVCHNSDIQNAMESRDLQAALCTHLPSCDPPLSEQRLILAIQNHACTGIDQAEENFPLRLFPYRIKEVVIDELFADTVLRDRSDDLAKKFHNAWEQLVAQKPEREQLVAQKPKQWNTLSFFEKESNRDAADHAAIKARFAGVASTKVRDCLLDGHILDSNDLSMFDVYHDSLVRMEIRRYRAFMFIHGFSHGNSCSTDQELEKIFSLRPVDGETSSSNASKGKETWGNLAKDFDRYRKTNETLLDANLSKDQKLKDSKIVTITKSAFQMGSTASNE